MSDDWGQWLTAAVERIKAWWQRCMDNLRAALDRMVETFHHLAKVLRPLMTARVKESWRRAQQSARFLSRHPDLSEFDGWLDRMYSDPATR